MPTANSITANHISSSGDVTVEGNLSVVGGSSKKFSTTAPATFSSSLFLAGLQGTFVDAAAAASYTSVASTTGTLDVTGKSVMLLDFSAFNGTTKPIDTLKMPTAVSGQVILFIIKTGASAGIHTMVKTNTGNITGTDALTFAGDYGSFEMIGVGNVWVVRSLQGVTIE